MIVPATCQNSTLSAKLCSSSSGFALLIVVQSARSTQTVQSIVLFFPSLVFFITIKSISVIPGSGPEHMQLSFLQVKV